MKTESIRRTLLLSAVAALIAIARPAAAQLPTYVGQWGSWGHGGQGYLFETGGIVADNAGFVYVSDWGEAIVQKFTRQGEFVLQWSLAVPGEAHYPMGIAISPEGTVLVADSDSAMIQEYSPTGQHIRRRASLRSCAGSSGAYPTGLAMQGNGDLLIGGFGAGARLRTNDECPEVFGGGGRSFGIACGPDGRIFVSDYGNHCVRVFSAGGLLLETWGSRGSAPGMFYQPTGIAVARDGTVFVSEMGNNRVQVLSAQGEYIGAIVCASNAADVFDAPNWLTLDAQGRLYVDDYSNRRIVVYEFAATSARSSSWGAVKTRLP